MSDNYLGNSNLVAKNVPYKFTNKEIEEFKKCINDPIYFIEKYVRIVHVDKGVVPFKFYPFQKELAGLYNDNRFVITKCPRQCGKTASTAAFILHQSLFKSHHVSYILANKGDKAREILHRIKDMYERLPRFLKHGIGSWNKGDIEFENGSKIYAVATSANAIRGESANLVYLDEFAFVENNIASDFFASCFPTISSGTTTKVFITSTPKGLNYFYKMWTDAKNGRNNFKTFECHWSMVPGRNQKWKADQISVMGIEKWNEEYECEFLGSADTLVSGSKLQSLVYETPIVEKDGVVILEEPVTVMNGGVLDENRSHVYILTCDVARNHNDQSDYCAASVIDISVVPFRQVARYRKQISPLFFPDIIAKLGKKYNNAWVLMELNDLGESVITSLVDELEYEYILRTENKGRSGQVLGMGKSLGVWTSKSVKRIGCSNLKTLIENDKLIINDYDTINELSQFVSVRGTFKADSGSSDDLVMTLVIFAWATGQKYFENLTTNTLREVVYKENREAIEDEMISIGFDNGIREEPVHQQPNYYYNPIPGTTPRNPRMFG